jgi:LmbE family N-acetylglucosaminyl deacetylase
MIGALNVLLPTAPLLVMAPHPDDEILGCARLMQQAAIAGCPLVIAWLTDGEVLMARWRVRRGSF